MPSKRRLDTSEICFGTEKAGLLDFPYNKCALADVKNSASNLYLPVNLLASPSSPYALTPSDPIGSRGQISPFSCL